MNTPPTYFIHEELETQRTHLRLLTLSDSQAVLQHFQDPEVIFYLDFDEEGLNSISDAERIIQYHIDDTGCRWGIFHKETDQLIGTCGYHCWRNENTSCAEVGYDLAREFWGQGIMREVLEILIDYGFYKMQLTRIEATSDPENTRSIRLLERLGFLRKAELRNGLLWYYIEMDKHS